MRLQTRLRWLGWSLLFVASAAAETFPGEPFNGLQITYSLTGGSVGELRDVPGFTWVRTIEGRLGGGRLAVSGTVMATSGYGGAAVIHIKVDDKQNSQQVPIELGKTLPFNVSVPIPEGAKSGTVKIGLVGEYNAGRRGVSVYGTFTSDYVKVPCKEALFYYTNQQLDGYYTDQPSLRYGRDQLAGQLAAALDKYCAEGGQPKSGVGEFDSPLLAAAFATGAKPTGLEDRLHTRAAEYAATLPGGRLTPGDLFYVALKVNSGNVDAALRTCHAALYRGRSVNKPFVNQHCLPLRNPAGYSDTLALKTSSKGGVTSPRQASGADEQGVWYHFFGTAALEFSDQHGLTPFFIDRLGAEQMDHTGAARALKGVFPQSAVGTRLSSYAAAIENEIRSRGGSPPDPDKQCINFSGVAAGTALAERLNLRRSPAKTLFVGTSGDILTPSGVVYYRSPLSIIVVGTNRESVWFDQQTKEFGSNTPNVVVEPFDEGDGTWGLILTCLFPISTIRLEGVADAPATVALYSYATKQASTFSFQARPEQVLWVEEWTDKQPKLFLKDGWLKPIPQKPEPAPQRAATDDGAAARVPADSLGDRLVVCSDQLGGAEAGGIGTRFQNVSAMYGRLLVPPGLAHTRILYEWQMEGRTVSKGQGGTGDLTVKWYRIYMPSGGALPAGNWALVLKVDGQVIATRRFVIQPQ